MEEITLFHYTNENAAALIKREKLLKMSTRDTRDAVYGDGVYFTSLCTDESKPFIIVNNWDGRFPWRIIQR